MQGGVKSVTKEGIIKRSLLSSCVLLVVLLVLVLEVVAAAGLVLILIVCLCGDVTVTDIGITEVGFHTAISYFGSKLLILLKISLYQLYLLVVVLTTVLLACDCMYLSVEYK